MFVNINAYEYKYFPIQLSHFILFHTTGEVSVLHYLIVMTIIDNAK